MLGDGIVSLGLAVVTLSFRNEKSSPKIVSVTPSLPSICIAAGVNSTSPSGLWNSTRMSPGAWWIAVERVDEVHVPGGAAELAVGRRLQADVVLHA